MGEKTVTAARSMLLLVAPPNVTWGACACHRLRPDVVPVQAHQMRGAKNGFCHFGEHPSFCLTRVLKHAITGCDTNGQAELVDIECSRSQMQVKRTANDGPYWRTESLTAALPPTRHRNHNKKTLKFVLQYICLLGVLHVGDKTVTVARGMLLLVAPPNSTRWAGACDRL